MIEGGSSQCEVARQMNTSVSVISKLWRRHNEYNDVKRTSRPQ